MGTNRSWVEGSMLEEDLLGTWWWCLWQLEKKLPPPKTVYPKRGKRSVDYYLRELGWSRPRAQEGPVSGTCELTFSCPRRKGNWRCSVGFSETIAMTNPIAAVVSCNSFPQRLNSIVNFVLQPPVSYMVESKLCLERDWHLEILVMIWEKVQIPFRNLGYGYGLICKWLVLRKIFEV